MPVRSAIFRSLVAQIAASDDAAERQRLAVQIEAQYDEDMTAQADYVQSKLSDIQIVLEDDLARQFGATNDMISEAIKLTREGRAAVSELRTDFQSFVERDDDWRLSAERRLDEYDLIVQDFRQSRDRSIADRKQLFDQYEQSHDDRKRIWQAIKDQDDRHSRQWQEISERLAALERGEWQIGEP